MNRVDALAVAVFAVWSLLVWAWLVVPMPVVIEPTAPEAPRMRFAAMLPALPTNLDSTWTPGRQGAYRGITGEWIVRR